MTDLNYKIIGKCTICEEIITEDMQIGVFSINHKDICDKCLKKIRKWIKSY